VVVGVVPTALSPLVAEATTAEEDTASNSIPKAFLFRVDKVARRAVEVARIEISVSDNVIKFLVPPERFVNHQLYDYFIICGQEMRLEF
jgi:hypothetical protein